MLHILPFLFFKNKRTIAILVSRAIVPLCQINEISLLTCASEAFLCILLSLCVPLLRFLAFITFSPLFFTLVSLLFILSFIHMLLLV